MAAAKYSRAQLSNGIRLVCEAHSHVRSVSLGVWIKVGSSFEKKPLNGVSHYIEHMVFKGTKNLSPLEIATRIEALGGDLNAFTDREHTCYHATLLAEHLDVGLEVLSQLIAHPLFPKDELERERKVLLQELSMVEESPDDRIYDLFFETVFPTSPIGQSVIGSRKSIQGITRAGLLKYYEEHYIPENIVISVAGNVNFVELVAKCEELFGEIGLDRKAKKAAKAETKLKFHSARRPVKMDTEQMHLLVGFQGPGFKDEGRFESLIMSFFLGGGMSSRLFQEIREKEGLAYSVDCESAPFSNSGLMTVYLATQPKSLSKCLDIISREIRLLQEKVLTDREIGIVKGQLKGSILLSNDYMDTRQESLGRNEMVFNRYVPVEEVIGALEAVTPDGVRAIAKKVFVPKKESVVAIGPKRVPVSSLTLDF